MAEHPCLVCGKPSDEEGLPYRCAYCGEFVCTDHRLPENHGCTGERLPSDESPEGRGPKPMELGAGQTVGTTPDDIGQQSPDVTLNGKVAGQNHENEEADTSWWRRLLPW
ncbi:MAG: AN1-type zinc finger domain-containing protein [Haloferacaceae archaeon]